MLQAAWRNRGFPQYPNGMTDSNLKRSHGVLVNRSKHLIAIRIRVGMMSILSSIITLKFNEKSFHNPYSYISVVTESMKTVYR
jgi:hypothetical protein